MAQALATWWWAWLGAALVILPLRQTSVTLVGNLFGNLFGILLGILLLATGIQEVVMAAVDGGWRWLALAGAGCGRPSRSASSPGALYALIYPVTTLRAKAQVMGIRFALVGIVWLIAAFARRATTSGWWVGMNSGPSCSCWASEPAGSSSPSRHTRCWLSWAAGR